MAKLKTGDRVLVIAGNDRGRTGTVLRLKGDRVVVQGMNIRKKHAKRRAQVQTPSRIEIEMPLAVSNVCLCDEESKRIDLKVKQSDQEKELYYLRDGKEVAWRKIWVKK